MLRVKLMNICPGNPINDIDIEPHEFVKSLYPVLGLKC
jgi:hypothetical protein